MDDEPSEAATADGGGTKSGGIMALKLPNSGASSSSHGGQQDVVVIARRGDVMLEVLFETSKETLRSSRKAAAAAAAATRARRPASSLPGAAITGAAGSSGSGSLKSKLHMAFRVEAAALKKHSRYFANLLGDTRFQEARAVEAALAALALEHVKPADVDVSRLPRVHIDDDDEESRTVGRELVFAELLRILHWDGQSVGESVAAEPLKSKSPAATKTVPSKSASTARTKPLKPSRPISGKVAPSKVPAFSKAPPSDGEAAPTSAPLLPGSRWSAKSPPTMAELATLALQADRFACTETVATFVKTLRIRFPQPLVRTARDGDSHAGKQRPNNLPILVNEEAIRQKVFVSWLLDQPLRFHAGTYELVLYGSRRWAVVDEEDEQDEPLPVWWDLPDGLERELQYRRECVLNCIASVPRHFLALYAARSGNRRQQCKMGYESSAACDSFQLGEIVKFLYQKDLLFLQDFSGRLASSSSGSHVTPADYAAVDVHHILATLKQCPAYQLDKHHVNCGLRTRLLPILEYIQAMLTAGSLAVSRHSWRAAHHGHASWLAAAEAAGLDEDSDDDDDENSDHTIRNGDNDNYARVPKFGKPGSGAAKKRHVFRFTRSVAGDLRLRLEGSMTAERLAQELFRARKWNWTPED